MSNAYLRQIETWARSLPVTSTVQIKAFPLHILDRLKLLPVPTRPTSPEKGGMVRFVGGKYKGWTGWKNSTFAETKNSVHVIVNLGNKQHATRVSKSSIVDMRERDLAVEEEKEISRKGSPIRFVRGTYKGKTGWKHPLGTTTKSIHVVVDMGDGQEIETMVLKTSVGNPHPPPASIQEAALLENPKFDEALSSIVLILSTMDFKESIDGKRKTILDPDVRKGFISLFDMMLVEAGKKQITLGSDAVWNSIKFAAQPKPHPIGWQASLSAFAEQTKNDGTMAKKRESKRQNDIQTEPSARREFDTSMDIPLV